MVQRKLVTAITNGLQKQVPATGIALLRIFYGLITAQEILFLFYFQHLIFDPVPYLDEAYPLIPLFLGLWLLISLCLSVGYKSSVAAIGNYVMWIIFTNFTPMQRDFDGGFDQFMISLGFFMIFLPINKSLSIDNLILKLRYSTINFRYTVSNQVSVINYYIPVAICLGFLYFDSAIHKLSAEHWRNGLGAWLPSSHPYYVSPLDTTWLLNQLWLQQLIGYAIIVFQFCFLFLCFYKIFRVPLLLIGAAIHLGITLTLNIYPFGISMLSTYVLMVPFSWWRTIKLKLSSRVNKLTVYYDELCPLCLKTVIAISHVDLFQAIEFKGLQTYAKAQPALNNIPEKILLADLYSLDKDQHLHSGIDTYIQIGKKMKYPYLFAKLLEIPGIYHLARHIYRRIADNRKRTSCDEACLTPQTPNDETYYPNNQSLYDKLILTYGKKKPKELSIRLAKIILILAFLQINSTLHYGILYRINPNLEQLPIPTMAIKASNTILLLTTSFLGITPHALYLHDHFEGYNHLIGVTYKSGSQEKWLPFVSPQGRLLSPNWGRVHSMWANVAVTPDINVQRLTRFLKKIIIFWSIKSGIPLENTVFIIKTKRIKSPPVWEKNLLHENFSQAWLEVGKAKWEHNALSIDFSDEIESL